LVPYQGETLRFLSVMSRPITFHLASMMAIVELLFRSMMSDLADNDRPGIWSSSSCQSARLSAPHWERYRGSGGRLSQLT
jgi:hypothetical protein